jgi:hypothetical protein
LQRLAAHADDVICAGSAIGRADDPAADPQVFDPDERQLAANKTTLSSAGTATRIYCHNEQRSGHPDAQHYSGKKADFVRDDTAGQLGDHRLDCVVCAGQALSGLIAAESAPRRLASGG